MGNGVDETVMLFVAANLADQKDGVHDQPGNHRPKKICPRKSSNAFAPVQDDPADVRGRRRGIPGKHRDTMKKAMVLRRLADTHGRILPRGRKNVWDGHSCPPPLGLSLVWFSALARLWVGFDCTGQSLNVGGQECPPHTSHKLGQLSARASAGTPFSSFLTAQFVELNAINFLAEPGLTCQHPDAVPVQIDLVPAQDRDGQKPDAHGDCCASLRRRSAWPPTSCWWKDRGSRSGAMPQMWVAEFTSQVACSPTTVRKNTPTAGTAVRQWPTAPRPAQSWERSDIW